ncbi:unnamed protein product [Citrullus colocynthis]|uniref:ROTUNDIFOLIA like 8 n=1 Tax=Citrullus colocynthis TaxID=252529 RepID=A0ABP0Z5J3_9ROSI
MGVVSGGFRGKKQRGLMVHALPCQQIAVKMKVMMMSSSGSSKRRLSSPTRGFGGVVREQRAKLYIIRRCVVMLLCWHD